MTYPLYEDEAALLDDLEMKHIAEQEAEAVAQMEFEHYRPMWLELVRDAMREAVVAADCSQWHNPAQPRTYPPMPFRR